MYQLSRLLHDYHRELYSHLEEHEVCPSLYAAPWFLTLFASQFPLGFVGRIFGKCVCVGAHTAVIKESDYLPKQSTMVSYFLNRLYISGVRIFQALLSCLYDIGLT